MVFLCGGRESGTKRMLLSSHSHIPVPVLQCCSPNRSSGRSSQQHQQGPWIQGCPVALGCPGCLVYRQDLGCLYGPLLEDLVALVDLWGPVSPHLDSPSPPSLLGDLSPPVVHPVRWSQGTLVCLWGPPLPVALADPCDRALLEVLVPSSQTLTGWGSGSGWSCSETGDSESVAHTLGVLRP